MANEYNTSANTGYNNLSNEALRMINDHKIKVATTKNSHEENMIDKTNAYKLQQQKNKIGIIGRLFGNADHASKNITAIICLSLIVGASIISIIVYFYKCDTQFVKSMWVSILPVVTLSLGYLFGNK